MDPTPNRLITRDQVALLVIDVQERLLPAIHEGERVVTNIVKLLRFADIIDLPVLLTEQQKLGETVEPIRAEIPSIPPIRKLDFGCFRCGEFVEAVRALGRTTLVLTGIEAHICVAQTALQALGEHVVHVVSDAVSSRSALDKQVALDRLGRAGAIVTSTEMLMYELLGCAGTDEFRRVLVLVKGS